MDGIFKGRNGKGEDKEVAASQAQGLERESLFPEMKTSPDRLQWRPESRLLAR